MKKGIFTFVVLFIMTILCGCGATKISFKEENKSKPTGDSSWTVMIYACSDNGGKASRTIEELTQIKYPANVNVVMQTGGGGEWENDGIDGEYLQRFVMQKGSMYLKDQKQSASMGSYDTFSDFINWGINEFSADKYMLILMGDGNGMEVLNDQNYQGDTLNIEEMYYALSKTNTVLDAICFDGAYMSSLEMATALSTYAKYMVASEEKCSGFDYRALIDCIIEFPDAGVGEMCNEMCNAYLRKCEKEGNLDMAQLSCIDLSQMTNLNLAFDGMAHELLTHSKDLSALGGVTRMMESAQRCAGSQMVDILSLANALKEVAGETPDNISEALSLALRHSVKGKMRSQSYGISVYYPEKTEEWTLNEYMKHSHSDNYKTFLKNTITDTRFEDEYISTDYTDTPAWEQYNEYELSCSSGIEGEKAVLNIAPNMQIIKNVTLKKYFYNKKSRTYFECISTQDLECLWDENTYKSELSKKIPVINGVAVDADIASKNSEYTIYSVKTIINDEKLADLFIAHNTSNDKYSYIGLWDNGTFTKGTSKDKVTLLHTDEKTLKLLPTKTVKASQIKVKGKNPPKGKYKIEYEVEDIYRKKYNCDKIEYEISF